MYRKIAAQELADFLGTISHPIRIRIIEELKDGELDVSSLQKILTENQSRISQNLSLLKAQRLVLERKEGRRVYYRLAQPVLAEWLIKGLDIISMKADTEKMLSKAILSAKKKWGKA
jgi:DNA-binding transcriptional ArsR family regulator